MNFISQEVEDIVEYSIRLAMFRMRGKINAGKKYNYLEMQDKINLFNERVPLDQGKMKAVERIFERVDDEDRLDLSHLEGEELFCYFQSSGMKWGEFINSYAINEEAVNYCLKRMMGINGIQP